MFEKFCIFCGKKPENKNLEHVIPQWLIKMTGLEKEDVFSYSKNAEKHIPFMNFTFPACTECNSKFAKLEDKTKPVLEKVLNGQNISGEEISLLMMWFEKIRVGLWLANIYHNQTTKKFAHPTFFIKDSIVKADRLLSIQKIQSPKGEKREGIVWFGTNNTLFECYPDAFTMLINDYYFFSASCDNLVSSRLGFPGITKEEKNNFMVGRHKIANPIIQSFIPNKDSISFYQPIYRNYLNMPEFPFDDYVKEHSYDVSQGFGGVFVQKGNINNTRYLQPNDKVNVKLQPVELSDVLANVPVFQTAIFSKSMKSKSEKSAADMLKHIISYNMMAELSRHQK